MEGDVVQLSRGRRAWRVQEAVVEQSRLDQGELLLTGPMFGPKMVTAGGQVHSREQGVLHSHQLDSASFERFPRLTPGTRRPLLVRPGTLTVTQVSEGLRFDFDLPSGAYATTLLREFQKDDVEQPGVPAQMSE
jgi:tRNA pseudouridine13 synthase